MRKLLLLTVVLLVLGVSAAAGQSSQVCISQEAADKCAELADRDKASQEAIAARDKIIVDLKIELAKAVQKNSDQEAALVRLTALFEALIKSYTKPKKIGLINF